MSPMEINACLLLHTVFPAKRICGLTSHHAHFYRLSNVKSPATCCGAFIRYRDAKNLFSFDADKFTVFRAFNFEFHFTVCFSKQSVVTTATYVSASVEFGTTLDHPDRGHHDGPGPGWRRGGHAL